MAWIETNPAGSADPSKKLYIYWYDQQKKTTRKKVTKYFNTSRGKREAGAFLKKFNTLLQDQKFKYYFSDKLAVLTLKDSFEEFVKSRSIEKSSMDIYRKAFDHLVDSAGNIPLNKLTANNFITYVDYLKEKKLSANTQHTYTSHLKVIFNYFVNRKFIDENIIVPTKPEKIIPHIIPPDVLEKIFAFLKKKKDKHHYFIVKLLYYTGFRKSTLLTLTESNIDWNAGLIYYRNVKAKKNSVFPIHAELMKLLKEMKLKPGQKLTRLSGKDSFKFWNRMTAVLNINYTIHDLRRTFGSILANSNINIYDVQTLLDHSDVRTTQKFYTSLIMQRIKKDIDKNVQFAVKPVPKPVPKKKKTRKNP